MSGAADVDVWANETRWAPLVDEPATATYLHRGCMPLNEALGPDADAEEQAALLAEHSGDDARRPAAGSRSAFGDHDATVRVEPGRADLFERLRLGEDWPVERLPQGYVDGAADPASGRIGYTLPGPPAAVGLALLGRAAVRGVRRGRAARGADRAVSAAAGNPQAGENLWRTTAMSFHGAVLRNTDV